MDKIWRILYEHIEVLESRKTLFNFFDDLCYGDKSRVRKILYAFDLKIVDIITSGDTDIEKRNFILDKLQNDFYLRNEIAEEAVKIWEALLSIDIINKYRMFHGFEELKNISVFGKLLYKPLIEETYLTDNTYIFDSKSSDNSISKPHFSEFHQFLFDCGNCLRYDEKFLDLYIIENGVYPDNYLPGNTPFEDMYERNVRQSLNENSNDYDEYIYGEDALLEDEELYDEIDEYEANDEYYYIEKDDDDLYFEYLEGIERTAGDIPNKYYPNLYSYEFFDEFYHDKLVPKNDIEIDDFDDCNCEDFIDERNLYDVYDDGVPDGYIDNYDNGWPTDME